MRRRLLLGAAMVLLAGAAAVAILYQVGLRVQLDGGGTPHLTLIVDAETQAAAVVRHREAQRQEFARSGAVAAPTAAETAAAVTAKPADAAQAATVPAGPAPYWTEFRGPHRDGHYRERAIRTNWPAAGLKPLWKQPVGGGYASFAIVRSRAFTIEQRGPQEVVAAYDVATGRELWINGWDALFQESLGGDGPRATPTWADGIVYALGATGELRALEEATGRLVWRTNILEENGATNLDWGMAASPLVVDETIVVLPGAPNGRSVVGYDRRTGKRVWATLSDKQAYSSPMLVTIGGVRQILVFGAARLMGLSPAGGDLLWEYPWQTAFDINAGQPIVIGDNRVFLSSGYGTGAAVIEVMAGPNRLRQGRVAVRPDQPVLAGRSASADRPGGPPKPSAKVEGPAPRDVRFVVREVWRNNRMKNQFTSSVLHDGFIYGLDESILACINASTGELRWKGGRYGYGQVLLASGHLIVLAENGDLALVRATPERHEEIVRFPALTGKTWNHPAIADGFLLIRNLAEMAAFDVR